MTLQWRGDKCGHVEPANVDPSEDYKAGDSEPCVHCDKPDCLAIVEVESAPSKEESPEAWASKMPDKELLERMEGYAGDAVLPRAVAAEVIRRFNVGRRIL